MSAIRAGKKHIKDEKIARVKTGAHMHHGIDTTVWNESTFREVMGNLIAWRRAKPSVFPKVFPQELLHPSGWLGYVKTQAKF